MKEIKSINGSVLLRIGADSLFRANLSHSNLGNADLYNADLSGANLCNTNLSKANLSKANLRYTNMGFANLNWIDLSGADLSGADLSGANMSFANLSGADLSGADLSGADLSGANLNNIIVDANTKMFFQQCPAEGSFIGYKKVNNKIVKLLIPEDAKRSSATTLKCRCSKCKVLTITEIDGTISSLCEVASKRDNNQVYKIGEITSTKYFSEDRWVESGGICFFISRDMAVIHN